MLCIQHPEAEAQARCKGCAEPYCQTCLVDLSGEKFCAACKMSGIKEAPKVEQKMTLCTEAKTALACSLLGMVLYSFILGPIAVFTGFKARSEIKKDPTLTGSGVAAAAIVIGALVSLLAILNIMQRT